MKKLQRVLEPDEAWNLIRKIAQPTMRLSRTWDQREEIGERLLKTGGPDEWVGLLAAYAAARGRAGLSVSSSDQELVREAAELTAAEISCATNIRYEDAYQAVRDAYRRAFEQHRAAARASYDTIQEDISEQVLTGDAA